jgi:hypothetical protein
MEKFKQRKPNLFGFFACYDTLFPQHRRMSDAPKDILLI